MQSHAWLDLHDHRLAIMIPHLPNVQELVGIAVVTGPAVHVDSGATAATIHYQPIVQVRIACICCVEVCHTSQVPMKSRGQLTWPFVTLAGHTKQTELQPVEVVFLGSPAGGQFSSDQQQVKYSQEKEKQPNKEKLPGWREQKARKDLGWQTEMPGGRKKAWKVDPKRTDKKKMNMRVYISYKARLEKFQDWSQKRYCIIQI